MAIPKDKIYREHILEAITFIEQFIVGKTFTEFQSDVLLQSGVMRQLEIIGEIAKRLSEEFKDEFDALPWRKIAGMRDTLIHDYLEVDLEIVWKAATEDIKELRRILEE